MIDHMGVHLYDDLHYVHVHVDMGHAYMSVTLCEELIHCTVQECGITDGVTLLT